jgi:hypothetical protein
MNLSISSRRRCPPPSGARPRRPARWGATASLTALAAPGATLLLLAFEAGRRLVLPRAMDKEDIVALLGDGWQFEHGRSFVREDAPRPICRANPILYRLTWRLGAAAPPAFRGG